MISARRRQTKKVFRPPYFLLILVAVLFTFWFFVLSSHFWNGKDKLALTVRRGNGDASVVVFDPILSEVTTLTVPGDTEVAVARNLGIIRIKNVWQLGVNEGISGKLTAETLTNNFGFASFLWADTAGESLIGSNFFSSLKFIFIPGKTNLSLRDRLGIVIFSSRIGNSGRSEIDLGKSLFLQKTKLSDGEAGLAISEKFPERLTIYFADYLLTEKNVRVFINDGTGEYGTAEEFGKIVEIMGSKVVAINKKEMSDEDCVVTGGVKEYARKVVRVFSCKEKFGGENEVLTIELGSKFAKRF